MSRTTIEISSLHSASVMRLMNTLRLKVRNCDLQIFKDRRQEIQPVTPNTFSLFQFNIERVQLLQWQRFHPIHQVKEFKYGLINLFCSSTRLISHLNRSTALVLDYLIQHHKRSKKESVWIHNCHLRS